MRNHNSISCMSFNFATRDRPRPGRHFSWG